ncbi:CPBP family intramembrane metalloprotease [Fulvivirgaceae bacterium BMA10]|uniref:CPBP family intramembrane metalloprotease n=1 Tax=Splendidivirga corallicola TaxID=3051826 RepID=A0ABT8KVL3_9BACT|nr:CPBP family intramembrane metalloprotease [Fulvivirgaceae bacterium BMA10]
MSKFLNHVPLSENRPPFISFLVVLLISLGCFQAIGPIIGMIVVLPFFDFDLTNLLEVLGNVTQHPEAKVPVILIQGIASFLGFILVPLIYLRWSEKKPLSIFFNKQSIAPIPVLLTFFLTLTFMVVNSFFIEWNINWDLPDAVSEFENLARSFEESARLQTEFLTTFDNPGQFILALIVIAVIPAFGEELLFRGFAQNYLNKITGNIHAAIWITGFLFSLFHLQFYGLVPRMLLGVLFGYLYLWSGSLSTAIIAHFINNGFTLIMIYLYQLGLIEIDIEAQESMPFSTIAIFATVFITLAFAFRNYFSKKIQVET